MDSDRPKMITIWSDTFRTGDKIPSKYTCEGKDLSPHLSWAGEPKGTKSFAIFMQDYDAPRGIFTHWIIYNIPPNIRSLPEGISKIPTIESWPFKVNFGSQGINDFGTIGYGGPCPPPGKPHRYFFKIYALDKNLALPAGEAEIEIERNMRTHILATGELIGIYGR